MGAVIFQKVELDPLLEGGTDQLNGRMKLASNDPTTASVALIGCFDTQATCGAKEDGCTGQILLPLYCITMRCGGLAIGVCISHKIADGTLAVAFLNSWASKSSHITSENADIVPPPIFDSAKNFPPRDVLRYSHDTGITNKTIVTKRFIFNSSSIVALKNKASIGVIDSSEENDKFPTRVQAVSALIWRRVLALYRSKPKYAKICVAVHAVNLRPRMEPPVPNHTFGNYWTVAIAPAVLQTEQNARGHE
ncbi:hypothetical protein HAX54_016681 [Datura stramonium]|uniref:Uncharacterized protein n=1 Tax=Datura stramonium TaxID=4076 RepID=A0ABS8ULL2_DATST|nr:hypothetical protein [Datura stramonium]